MPTATQFTGQRRFWWCHGPLGVSLNDLPVPWAAAKAVRKRDSVRWRSVLDIPGSGNASGAGATPTAPAAPTPRGPPTQPALLTIRPQPPATSPTVRSRSPSPDMHPQQQTHLVVNTDHLHIAQPNQQLTHTRRINDHTDPPDSRCEQHRNRRIPPLQARTLTPPTPTSNAKSRFGVMWGGGVTVWLRFVLPAQLALAERITQSCVSTATSKPRDGND